VLLEYLAAQEPQGGEGGINKFCLQAANYHRHRHAKYLKASVDQSHMLGAFTPVMDNKPADILPEDKALIERQIASALCYLCGGVVIPTRANQNPWAHSRSPIDMMRQGCSTRLFQASQQ
jgi:hypothetical protein